MLNNMSVKRKLSLLLIGAIISCIGMSFVMHKFIWDTYHYGKIETEIEMIKSDMLMLRKIEKNFILSKDIQYKKKYETNYKKLVKDTKILLEFLKNNEIENKKVKSFLRILKDYKKFMYQYIDLQQQIGLDEKNGLYGSLRESVHKVQESAIKSRNNKLLVMVYDLRKQEKDFMLRRDLKYVEKFTDKIDALLAFDTLVVNERKTNLIDYKNKFLDLVDKEVEIGLTYKEGVQGVLKNTIEKSEELLHNFAQEIEIVIENKIKLLINITLFLSLIMLIVVTVFILYIKNKIATSINRFQTGLVNFFKYLNKESATVELLDLRSDDEFGKMAIVINNNIKKIETVLESDNRFLSEVTAMVEDVNKGYLYKRFENRVASDNLEQLRVDFNTMLENLNGIVGGSTNKVLNVLESYAQLDFTNGIKNDPGKIPVTLNNVNKLINEILVDNKANGLTLEESSNRLFTNVESLSRSSNEAAASLEETAAALEQITSNISNNTANVIEMANYANDVTDSANKGEELASKTAIAMDEINSKVSAINEAITVIDQIAFQTNILSLNAAVEAATAGESGKGFAVVAGEVRNLASRSAQAANEIKLLVENATQKANIGKEIADEMIEGYSDLNSSIIKTLELIEDVEMASKEQQQGIEQINNAVNELDQQTQKNASVANDTKTIARQTQILAKKIVSDSDEKEFIGKNEVGVKALDSNEKEHIKKENSEVNDSKSNQKDLKSPTKELEPIQSQIDDEDDWVSF